MALPPSDAGALQVRDADWLPAVAETAVGAPGAVAGGAEVLAPPQAESTSRRAAAGRRRGAVWFTAIS
jgi:hypothetical protein